MAFDTSCSPWVSSSILSGAPAGEVCALVALAAVEGGAGRAELVVERVDVDVAGFAGVAGTGLEQSSGEGPGGVRDQLKPLRLVVDPLGGAGSGQSGDGAVIGQHLVAAFGTALLLDPLKDQGGSPTDRHRVRVLARQLVGRSQHAKAQLQIISRYPGMPGMRLALGGGHPENCTRDRLAPHTSP